MSIKKVNNFNFKTWLKDSRIQIIVLIALTLIAYANTLDNNFLSDDIRAIVNRPELGDWSYVKNSFPRAIRPFIYFSITNLFGKTPAPFRAVNILFHLGIVLTTFLIIYLIHNQTIAFISSLLMAIHPIITESVTWISGGFYTVYSFFILLAFLFFVLGYKKTKYLYFSVVAYGFAVLSSAHAMIYPFILTAFVIFWPEVKIKKIWKKLIAPWLLGTTIIITAAIKIPHRLEGLRTKYYQNPKMLNPLTQIPTAVPKYLELIFWPKKLTLYHTEVNLLTQTQFIKFAVVFGIFTIIAVYTFFKNKKLFFWFTFFSLALGPTLTPFGVSWLVAERYVRLASLGLFVLFAWVVSKLNKMEKIKNIPLIIFITIIVPILTLRTIVRNNVWQNQDRLWLAAAKYSPHSAQNHNNLGDLYGRHGDFEKSIFHFKKAIELRPGYADAYHNVANIYWRTGNIEIAIKNYERAEEINPRIWQTHQNLGILYFQKGDHQKALDQMNKAVQLNPNSSQLYANLAKMYAKMGNEEKAQQAAQKSKQLSAP